MMDGGWIVFLSIVAVVSFLAGGFCGSNTTEDFYQQKAIALGHAEYVIVTGNNQPGVYFRWKNEVPR